MATLLIVEDDRALRTGLIDNLEFEGYQVLCADNGDDGLRMALEDHPDLLLLDLALPKQDGLSVCQKLRQCGHILPVIMLTAKSEESHKIRGLNVGADDYVTKPFSIKELLARIKSQLRRSEMNQRSSDCCTVGDALVMFDRNTVQIKQNLMELNASEAEILRLLVTNRGSVVSREKFISAIAEGTRFTNTRALDNCIVKLRKKLEPDPAHPTMILTVHGKGYKLLENRQQPAVGNL